MDSSTSRSDVASIEELGKTRSRRESRPRMDDSDFAAELLEARWWRGEWMIAHATASGDRYVLDEPAGLPEGAIVVLDVAQDSLADVVFRQTHAHR